MKKNSGFTLIEILMALIIFASAIFGIVQSRTSSVRNIFESERVFEATQLAQLKVSELELKYQSLIDKDGVTVSFAKDSGTFEKPYEAYKWNSELKESTLLFKQRDLFTMLMNLGLDKETAEAQLEQQKLVLTNLNKVLKENFAELMVKISWNQFGKTRSLPFVTHLIPKKPKIELTQTAEDSN